VKVFRSVLLDALGVYVVRLEDITLDPPVAFHALDTLNVETESAIDFILATCRRQTATGHDAGSQIDSSGVILGVEVKVLRVEGDICLVLAIGLEEDVIRVDLR
jgi:hypothetical protein